MMKKIVLSVVAGLAISMSVSAQDNIEHRAKQKAEAAARECLRDAGMSQSLELISTATLNLYCDYFNPNPNYAGFSVEVSAKPNCPPNQACIQVIYPVATVYVDCQGNVYDIICHGPIEL